MDLYSLFGCFVFIFFPVSVIAQLGVCRDNGTPEQCQVAFAGGACNIPNNRELLMQLCARTCGFCDGGGANPCSPSPCQRGVCNVVGTTAQCTCPQGFTGTLCETSTGDCRDNGTPQQCRDAFMAGACDIPNNRELLMQLCARTCGFCDGGGGQGCASNPCVRGTCINAPSSGGAGYQCDCPAGFTGFNCDIVATACVPNPCNGGTCRSNQNGGFACQCPLGRTGTSCQNDICTPNPCRNNGQCRYVRSGGYQCFCSRGYSGRMCEIAPGCAPNPCSPGMCNQGAGSRYMCVCPGNIITTSDCSNIGANCMNYIDDSICARLASMDQCRASPLFMVQNCPRACNVCGPDAATNCNDYGNGFCPSLAANGNCTTNPAYMMLYCRQSCNVCQPDQTIPPMPRGCTQRTPAGQCRDQDVNCQDWQRVGYCMAYATYMETYCPQVCGCCTT